MEVYVAIAIREKVSCLESERMNPKREYLTFDGVLWFHRSVHVVFQKYQKIVLDTNPNIGL